MKLMIKSILENDIKNFKKYYDNTDSYKIESLFMDYCLNKQIKIYIEQIMLLDHEPDCNTFKKIKNLGINLQELKTMDIEKIKYLIND